MKTAFVLLPTLLLPSFGASVACAASMIPAPVQGAVAESVPRVERVGECFARPPDDLEFPYRLDCGYVVVPEFHKQESETTLKLAFLRINSGKGPARSPLFILAGGPGETDIKPEMFLLFQKPLLGRILDERDIVLLDQRGAGHSQPLLDCPELYSLPWVATRKGLDEAGATRLQAATLQACRDGFEAQGLHLDAFNSVESAADVDAARRALGYERIVYYGGSYAAQLGQHVMREHPGILEGVVLDGANALSRKTWVEDRALDAQWGIDNLAKLCEANEKCRAAYDIPRLLSDALALFGDGTRSYTYVDPADPKVTLGLRLTKADLVNLVYAKQGTAIGSFSLPAILDQLNKGGVGSMLEILGRDAGARIVASRSAREGGMAFLMHLAVVCSDDPVHSVDDVNTKGVGEYARTFGRNAAETYAALCPLLHVKELPPSTDVNVRTSVPALLLAGDLDVATPSSRTREVADALPNSTFVLFHGRTHVQIAGANVCAAQMMTQFVHDPTSRLETSCSKGPSPYSFVLPDGTTSR